MPLIFCDQHPNQIAMRFCRTHQALICKECLIEGHIDHSQDCKAVSDQSIKEFFNHHSSVLMSINEKLVDCTEDLAAFLNQEKSFKSSDFLRFVSILKRFGAFNQHLQSEVEEQK
jgi:hypothetical protein